MYGNVKIVIH